MKLGTASNVRVIGKGRKKRCTTLSKATREVIAAWLHESGHSNDQALFPNARGQPLSAHRVHYILAKHVAAASLNCPSLKHKLVSPHIFRHTTAMDLLQAGVDRSVIALWLGHESINTTQIYLDADLEMKERMLSITTPPDGKCGLYRPEDSLLKLLKEL